MNDEYDEFKEFTKNLFQSSCSAWVEGMKNLQKINPDGYKDVVTRLGASVVNELSQGQLDTMEIKDVDDKNKNLSP